MSSVDFCIDLTDTCVVTDWTKNDEEGKDLNVWRENWDDDTIEDDFSIQLRFVHMR